MIPEDKFRVEFTGMQYPVIPRYHITRDRNPFHMDEEHCVSLTVSTKIRTPSDGEGMDQAISLAKQIIFRTLYAPCLEALDQAKLQILQGNVEAAHRTLTTLKKDIINCCHKEIYETR